MAAFGAEGAVSAHGGGAAGERVFVGADRAQGDHTRLHRTAGSHVGGGSLEKTDLLCGRAKILLILAEAALGLSCAAALVFGYEFRAIYWLRFLLYTALLLASAATQAYAERRQKVN